MARGAAAGSRSAHAASLFCTIARVGNVASLSRLPTGAPWGADALRAGWSGRSLWWSRCVVTLTAVTLGRTTWVVDPLQQAQMEQFGVNMSEDPPKGNVRGNAIRHLQKHLQSDLFTIAELRNRDLVVGTSGGLASCRTWYC